MAVHNGRDDIAWGPSSAPSALDFDDVASLSRQMGFARLRAFAAERVRDRVERAMGVGASGGVESGSATSTEVCLSGRPVAAHSWPVAVADKQKNK